ncbi:glycosyltransferase [Pseudoalteromonas sp. DL2-H2.2]|uniref:glycosyltransferase n=1 Tax=Pseudoalteromonas sp. DL2-H2.2 TaxID=2908889 RepID=UPI001F437363|nr:glycosyltransferase [Pseudoalteromonas sp. DL2-H2.2]MCF2908830.1 glycosyltransferase [Pseudoalteromonas sp. DL2-H2.2]
MKILVVTPSFEAGGAENIAVMVANGLKQNAQKVDVFTLNGQGPLRARLSTSIKVKVAGSVQASKAILELRKYIREHNVDVIFCSLGYMVAFCKLSIILSGKKVKLIAREATMPSAAASQRSSVSQYAFRALISWAYRFSNLVIAPSKTIASDIENYYRVGRNVHILANPVNAVELQEMAKADVAWELPFKPESYTVISALGRLHQVKDHEMLIKAYALTKSKSRTKLVIIGDGEEKEALSKLIAEKGLKDNVFLLGHKSNPFPYLKLSSIFVQTSRLEGMPNALIQASVLENHLLATACPGAVSELMPEDNLVSVGNAQELARKIDSCLQKGISATRLNLPLHSESEYCSELLRRL